MQLLIFRLTRFSLLLSLVLISFSCRKKELSSLVDQNDIYVYLRLSYNDFYHRTYASAQFYTDNTNGNRLILSQNSRVFYGNTELETATRRGTKYSASFDTYLSGETFDWNDTEDQHYLNIVQLPPSISVDNEYADFWSNSWGHDVYWNGDTLAANEEIRLTLEVSGDTSFTIEVSENRIGENHVHIPAWRMEDLYGYSAEMRISRVRYLPIQESPAAGGEIVTSYESEGSWLYHW